MLKAAGLLSGGIASEQTPSLIFTVALQSCPELPAGRLLWVAVPGGHLPHCLSFLQGHGRQRHNCKENSSRVCHRHEGKTSGCTVLARLDLERGGVWNVLLPLFIAGTLRTKYEL